MVEKVIQTFSPDHKNIIDIAKPSVGIKRGIFQNIRFESTKKKVGKRGGHFSTHGCAMDLKVVVIIKRKIIHGENHANKVTECTSRNVIMRASA